MAGVTSTGFVTKRFPEVIEGLREQAVPIFQDLVSPGDFVDTGDSTVIGRMIGLTSPALAELWEAMQEVYSAFDPNTASGVALDNLAAIGGLTRKSATYTTFSGLVWGDTNTTILAGSGVKSNSTANQFVSNSGLVLSVVDVVGIGLQLTDTSVGSTYSATLISVGGSTTISTTAIGGDTATTILNRLLLQLSSSLVYSAWVTGDILYIKILQHYSLFNVALGGDLAVMKVAKRLTFSASEVGPTEVDVHTVNIITTPVLGWDSVDNPVPAVIGSADETDIEFRERFRVSKYLRASNTEDALYSALLELSDVEEVRLYVNDTSTTNSIGLAPHSFLVLILGGLDIDIAKTIWKHNPLGIKAYGAQAVSIETAQGNEQVVRFDRPVYVPLFVEIDLTTFTDFPEGGQDLIKEALVNYFTENQTIGNKVVYSRLFTPVNSIPGHEIVTLKIGTSAGSVSETTLSMAYNQIPTLSADNITFI